MRRSHTIPARRRVSPLSRFPHRRKHRCQQIQRRSAWRQRACESQDRETRQQDPRHHRNTLWQDHRHGEQALHFYRLDTQGVREGQNQSAQGRRHDRSQRRDTHSPHPRRQQRQDHRRPLCLYRLRGEHLAQLLRHRREEAPVSERQRRFAPLGRQHHVATASGTPDTQRRTPRTAPLHEPRTDIHRGAHLQGQEV